MQHSWQLNWRASAWSWIFGAGLVMSACTGDGSRVDDASAPSTEDPASAWLRPAAALGPAGSTSISPRSICSVVDELQAEAQALLEASSWCVLDAETLRRFTGARLDPGPETVPVLLRAVRSSPDASGLEKDDGWRVLWKDGIAEVTHYADRRAQTSRARHAIVALMPGEPTELYVMSHTVILGLPNIR